MSGQLDCDMIDHHKGKRILKPTKNFSTNYCKNWKHAHLAKICPVIFSLLEFPILWNQIAFQVKNQSKVFDVETFFLIASKEKQVQVFSRRSFYNFIRKGSFRVFNRNIKSNIIFILDKALSFHLNSIFHFDKIETVLRSKKRCSLEISWDFKIFHLRS